MVWNSLASDRGHIHRVWYRFLSSEQPDWWYWRCADHLWGSAVEVAKLAGVRTIFAAGVDSDVQPRRALFRRSRWWPLYAWGLSRTDIIFVQHGGQLADLPRDGGRRRLLSQALPGGADRETPLRAGEVCRLGSNVATAETARRTPGDCS